MSLSYKDVADIIKIIDASSCDELVLELADTKIVVRRGGGGREPSFAAAAEPRASGAEPAELPQKPAIPSRLPEIPPSTTARGNVIVRSPMVGTFYRAPSPKDPPFVEVGSLVKLGDPLCVIEVMKLFTTVTADRAGAIVSIYPGNAELVEFDQPLIELKPA